MKNFQTRTTALVGIGIFAVLFLVPLHALPLQTTNYRDELAKPGLRGINGINVVPDVEVKDTDDRDLLTRQLRTDVELRLRKAGIRVLSDTEYQTALRGGVLGLTVLATRTEDGLIAYSTSVTFSILATASHNGQIINATIWNNDSVAVGGKERFVTAVREDISDSVDEFLNAYLAANPKK
jgi:hypothetical protein